MTSEKKTNCFKNRSFLYLKKWFRKFILVTQSLSTDCEVYEGQEFGVLCSLLFILVCKSPQQMYVKWTCKFVKLVYSHIPRCCHGYKTKTKAGLVLQVSKSSKEDRQRIHLYLLHYNIARVINNIVIFTNLHIFI